MERKSEERKQNWTGRKVYGEKEKTKPFAHCSTFYVIFPLV